MIVRRFLLWARVAPPVHRAEAVAALAQAYLLSDLSPEDRTEAETALTAMLDDPSPLVRRALAESLATSPDTPRHLVIALANDQSDIAGIMLSYSPVLTDADLIDCAALGDETVQTAIAIRPYLSVAVSAALAEIARPGALVALLGNAGAEVADISLARMVERHGADAGLREALLQRPDLPLEVRQAIAAAVSDALTSFVAGCGWLNSGRTERATREAQEKTIMALSASAPAQQLSRLVAYLRRTGQLTPALLLRALLSQNMAFVEAALADLTGFPPARVAALLHDRRVGALSALYQRAGLPKNLERAFAAAFAALAEEDLEAEATGTQLSRRMIERALAACACLSDDDDGAVTALLRRYEVEAARETAREMADALADDAALALVLEHQPAILIGTDYSEDDWRDAA